MPFRIQFAKILNSEGRKVHKTPRNLKEKSHCLLEVENKKVPDIKLEPAGDDFQIELVPHFKENSFSFENPEHTLDYFVHDHNYAKIRTKATTQINTMDELICEEWKTENEEITIKLEENDDRSLAEQNQAEIKLKTSNPMATLEELDLYKEYKIKNEEIIIKDEEDAHVFPYTQLEPTRPEDARHFIDTYRN